MDAKHERICMDAYLESTKSRRSNQAALEGTFATSRVGILEFTDVIEAYDHGLTFACYGKI